MTWFGTCSTGSSTAPDLKLIEGADAELDAELAAMVRETCLCPFDEQVCASADELLARPAPCGRLTSVQRATRRLSVRA
mgnify:CR=1 FL=1